MSIIINDLVDDYILDLLNDKDKDNFITDLRECAEIDKVPIITKDTESLMSVLLTMHRPKKMLEIGTAVGYSAISFTSVLPELEITTIEHSDKMYDMAMSNIEKAKLSSRIHVIKGDAREIIENLNETFDMIFIDAAKGHYKLFFDRCFYKLNPSGVIISDNVLYKGMTASNEFLIKRKRTIVKRMREYLKYISNLKDFETTVLPVGDGVAISVRKAGK